MATLRMRLITILCVLVSAVPVLAQVTGSITGTVRDSSGGVIPKAKVSVNDNDRGIHRNTVTNSSGDYLVEGLGEGTYTVEVSAPGFKRFVAENTVLHVGQNARIDAPLQVGSQVTEVTVEGSNAGVVETQSSELSTTITSTQISQLELNGRSFVQLIELSPGVSNQTGQSAGTTGPGGSVSYAVNGGRTEANNWEVDGGDVMDSGSMANLNVFPNIDALDQVQILTSSYDAQYGRSGSGTVEAVTKSGTNEFHGELFEYLRNQFFNAQNFFNPPDQPIGAYKKHDFGGTIGGPIVKNKLFFFYSEELRHENVPGFYNLAVPTNAERAGDFTAVCPTPGTPFSRTPGDPTYFPDCPGFSAGPVNVNGDNTYIGFANNNIASYIDQANAGPMLKLIPQQNTTDQATNLPYFRQAAPAPYTSHEELFKIDYNIKPSLHASFRFIHDQDLVTYSTSTPWATSNLPGIPGTETYPGISMVANLQWTASPTLTNESFVGYGSNAISIRNSTDAAALPATFTMPGIFDNNFGGKIPSFNIGGGASFSGLNQDAGPTPFNNENPTYTYRDTLTKQLHSNNLKVGFYFTANQKNEDFEAWQQGYLGFNSNGGSFYTSDPSTGGLPSSTGNSFADFLVGDIASYNQSNDEPKYHEKFKIFEPFVQDDWHVSRKLTLNLGFRMSMFGLYTEKNDLAYNFDPAAYNPAIAPSVDPNSGFLVFPAGQSINTITGIVQCGKNGIPAGCMKGHLWNPAPRVGFAYDPFGDGKTAIRAAYGIFFDHNNGNDANVESLEGQPPLTLTSYQYNIHGYANVGGGQYFPLIPNSIPMTKVEWPYVQQWHFDIQRELMKNTMATISYVGSSGTHLTYQSDLNQIQDLPAGQNPFAPGQPITNDVCANNTVDGTVNGPQVTGAAEIHLTVACGNYSSVDLYRTNFPGWDTIDGLAFTAHSSYNALQVSGRRTAKDLELTLAYTYSHSIDNNSDRYDGSFVDSYHPSASRASSNFDQRHIVNFSYIYTLPKLAQHSLLMRSVLGGWQYSGITEIQTGDPFSLTGPVYDNAGVANGEGTGSYLDKTPGVSTNLKHFVGAKTQPGIYGSLLYNPGAFQMPTGLTFGNTGRNSMHGPRTSNFDMGIFKHFPIKEKVTTEFRAEAFNVFNHTEVTGVNNGAGCYGALGSSQYSFGASDCVEGDQSNGILPSAFLHASAVHDPRILQFALKVIF